MLVWIVGNNTRNELEHPTTTDAHVPATEDITPEVIDRWPDAKLWAVMSLRTRAVDWAAAASVPHTPHMEGIGGPTALAHYLSHVQLWRAAASLPGGGVLVLDHDAQILVSPKDVQRVWEEGTPLLWLRQGARNAPVSLNATAPLTHYGGVAYVITPAGARLLLREALPASMGVAAYVGAVGAKHPGAVRVTAQVMVGGGGLYDIQRFTMPGHVRTFAICALACIALFIAGIVIGKQHKRGSDLSIISG